MKTIKFYINILKRLNEGKVYNLDIISEYEFDDPKSVRVFENPTPIQIKNLLSSSYDRLRFFIDEKSKSLFVWNAMKATHDEVYINLGLETDNGSMPKVMLLDLCIQRG